jgi:hypothetical protein
MGQKKKCGGGDVEPSNLCADDAAFEELSFCAFGEEPKLKSSKPIKMKYEAIITDVRGEGSEGESVFVFCMSLGLCRVVASSCM